MSRPIKFTEQMAKEVLAEFVEKMKERMLDGDIEYKTTYTWTEKHNAYVVFKPLAFAKMMTIIHDFSTEVAWHGVVSRDPEDDETFYIEDILVYPQVVDSADVDSDGSVYREWLLKLGSKLNSVRMQGHSHVTMTASPSGRDTSNWKELLSQVGDADFYIMMIANKKFEFYVRVYDLKNNIQYENKDVDVSVDLFGDPDLESYVCSMMHIAENKEITSEEMTTFLHEAKKMSRKKPYVPSGKWGGHTGYGNSGSKTNHKSYGSKPYNLPPADPAEDDEDYGDDFYWTPFGVPVYD